MILIYFRRKAVLNSKIKMRGSPIAPATPSPPTSPSSSFRVLSPLFRPCTRFWSTLGFPCALRKKMNLRTCFCYIPISESGGLATPPAAAAYPGAFWGIKTFSFCWKIQIISRGTPLWEENAQRLTRKEFRIFFHNPLFQPKTPPISQKLLAFFNIVFKHQTWFGISCTLFIPEVGRVLLVAYSRSEEGFDYLHHPRPNRHIVYETTGKILNEYRVDIC